MLAFTHAVVHTQVLLGRPRPRHACGRYCNGGNPRCGKASHPARRQGVGFERIWILHKHHLGPGVVSGSACARARVCVKASLHAVKALGSSGSGSYTNIIRGLGWGVVAHDACMHVGDGELGV